MSDHSPQQAVPNEGAASPRPTHERVALDHEYTDDELRASPYADIMRDAVVVGPDEYRSGPGQDSDDSDEASR